MTLYFYFFRVYFIKFDKYINIIILLHEYESLFYINVLKHL